MKKLNKCDLLKIVSWIFFASVMIQSLYSGLKFGCWWGLLVAMIGFIGGFIYIKFRKNKCKTE